MSKFNKVLQINWIIFIIVFSIEIWGIEASNKTNKSATSSSSTSGMYFPPPKTIKSSAPTAGTQSGEINNPSNSNLICVDSGTQGRRCGITAVTFCKLNPDAKNCKALLEMIK